MVNHKTRKNNSTILGSAGVRPRVQCTLYGKINCKKNTQKQNGIKCLKKCTTPKLYFFYLKKQNKKPYQPQVQKIPNMAYQIYQTLQIY